MSAPRQETQPLTYRPSFKALLSLPFRVCNPPPAVGKVRSCSVTPLLKISLEDILERKHLPPLGLKDFEEWLLYVENCPENLYFTLWLKEYTSRYHQWASSCKAQRQSGNYRDQLPLPGSSHLALFYARAKQTFFMPNSTYELDLPSDILAPFHTSDLGHHPDPLIFHEVSLETHKMLEECLKRFLNAQLTNVGNNRVLCGIIAGIICCFIGGVPPLVVNFVRGDSRWTRLAAFPGFWIGLTIFLAAINGICLGVYIFGDLRQLRKFELARPPISKPRPLGKQPISLPMYGRPAPLNIVSSVTGLPSIPLSPPPPAYVAETRLSRTSTRSSVASSSTGTSSSSDSSYDVESLRIEISAPYFDTDPIDNDLSPTVPDAVYMFPSKATEVDCSLFSNTAGFIYPYDSTLDSDLDDDMPKFLPEECQPISPFDFDALPTRNPGYCRSLPEFSTPPTHEILEIKSPVPPLQSFSATTFMERIQIRCNPKKWFVVTREVAAETKSISSPRSSFGGPISLHKAPRRHQYEKGAAVVRKHFKMVKAVPAFASLTRVLSPVVVRGQWEIVMRSAAIGFLLTWILLGILLAIPVFR